MDSSFEIRDLTVDDLAQGLDARNRSFGSLPSSYHDWLAMQSAGVAERRLMGATLDGRVVAMARINDFRQWWLGRPVRMAGIGGVVVAPEARGRGVGTALMTALMARAIELGFSTTALYPATVPVYRGIGYEFGGAQRIVSVPAAALRTLAGKGPYTEVRRAAPGDEQVIIDRISDWHERHRDAGPIEYRLTSWATDLKDEEYFTYLAEDGFLGYGFDDGNKVLRVSHLVGGSEATLRSLWSLVGSGSSIATTVHAAVAPDDPLHWLLVDNGLKVERETWWMLRLLDPAAAVAGRGFPPGAALATTLSLQDPQFPDLDGTWELTVADGVGALKRIETFARPDAVALGPRGLAALYAGWPMATLRRSGLASGGDPANDVLIDAAFFARPFMLDYF